MRAFDGLHRRVLALRFGGTAEMVERLDSLAPSPASDDSATVRLLGNKDIQDDVATRALSANTSSDHMVEAPQTQHGLDGAWKLVDTDVSSRFVNRKMHVFIVAGHTLTLADQKSFRVQYALDQKTILLGDAVLELVADGIAWLHSVASKERACYKRVDIPTLACLSNIEGQWQCRVGCGNPMHKP